MVKTKSMNCITHRMSYWPWHLQNRALVIDMIIVLITNNTINLSHTASRNVALLSTTGTLDTCCRLPSTTIISLSNLLHLHITVCLFLLLRFQHIISQLRVTHLPFTAILNPDTFPSLSPSLLHFSVEESALSSCKPPPTSARPAAEESTTPLGKPADLNANSLPALKTSSGRRTAPRRPHLSAGRSDHGQHPASLSFLDENLPQPFLLCPWIPSPRAANRP